jgi:hypothetical protein
MTTLRVNVQCKPGECWYCHLREWTVLPTEVKYHCAAFPQITQWDGKTRLPECLAAEIQETK